MERKPVRDGEDAAERAQEILGRRKMRRRAMACTATSGSGERRALCDRNMRCRLRT